MTRLLIVGIDGLPPTLLGRLIAEGHMPTLGDLARRGSFGVLRSTPNCQSASAWTSMMTGVNPGKHGILHFTNPVRGNYGVEQIDARTRRCPTIWRLLSDAGALVLSLNVPVSYPVEPVNGAMIAGWLCPSPTSPGFAYPLEIADEIARISGDYPIHPDVRRHVSRGDYEGAGRVARHGIAVKARVARHLICELRPDVAAVVFTETDSLQHWCWHILDERDPRHDAELSARTLDTLLMVYRELDAQVADLLDAAGGQVDVLVVSDHGQATNSGAQVLLRRWLMEAGYLVPVSRAKLHHVLDRIAASAFDVARRCLPARWKAALRARLPALQTRAQEGVRGIAADWSRTRAWTETGHIFVNLRGRWPAGVVEPGVQYEAVVHALEQELLSLLDADSGEPAVGDVVRGTDVFDGPYADLMPDLLVHWRHERVIRKLLWRGREITHPHPPTLPTGAHHRDGTLVVAGPSFVSRDQIPAQSIYDIAPTVLHLAGCSVPSYMDGCVLFDLLTAEAGKDVHIVTMNDVPDVPSSANRGAAVQKEEDETIVRARLRSLGYIDQG